MKTKELASTHPLARPHGALAAMLAVVMVVLARPATAAGPDQWIASLEWSPETCHRTPGSEEAQCRLPHGFILAALVPVFVGAPPPCDETPLPHETVDRASIDIPNKERIRRAWKRDGACSGLDQAEYLIQMGAASRRWQVPSEFRESLDGAFFSQQRVVDAFTRTNPELRADGIVVQCARRHLTEVRFCMDREFRSIACAPDLPSKCESAFKVRELPSDRGKAKR